MKSKQYSTLFKVIGVGNGGCSAIDYIYDKEHSKYSLVACDTDLNRLLASSAHINLLIGKEGLGNITNPKIRRTEAIKSKSLIKYLLSNSTRVCFIIAGMGGGTDTGVAPVIASIAKSLGIFTIGIVTTPYRFEGRRKTETALEGVKEMSKNVDELIVINYEAISDFYDVSNLSISEAYMTANYKIYDIIKVFAKEIISNGLINVQSHKVLVK